MHKFDLSPFYKQYFEIVEEYQKKFGDKTLVMIEKGDFYEIYEYDLPELKLGKSKELHFLTVDDPNVLQSLRLTKMVGSKEHSIKNPYMVGIPWSSFDKWKNIFLAKDYIIVKVNQFSIKGSSKKTRKVTEVISIGTDLNSYSSITSNVVCVFIENQTTDTNILFEASKHHDLIQKVEYLLAKSSIDCHAHQDKTIIDCKLCNTTNKELFSKTLNKRDILYDPCKKYEDEEVDAKEIKIMDKIFYYVLDDTIPDIYQEEGEIYKKINRSHELYNIILKKINDTEKLEIIGGSLNNNNFNFDEWAERL